MTDLALLILRLTVGSLVFSHGSQKLFGWFGGYGLEGTSGFLDSLGLKPGKYWSITAAMGEFVGGLLTALGLFNPVGPVLITSTMAMATGTAHRGKPIFATEGGAELPVTNSAAALATGIAGPGRYSLDRAFKIKIPVPLVALLLSAATLTVAIGIGSSQSAQKAKTEGTA